MIRERLKAFALGHPILLKVYRQSFGLIKTKFYFGLQKKALQKKGYSIIEQVDQALTEQGAQYFVDCGTLLGLIRDNKLIEHDKDMDFGIYFNKNFTPKDLDSAMLNMGMKRDHAYFYKGKVAEISYNNGITNVDFFRHIETKEHSLIYVFYRKPDTKYPDNKSYTVLEMHRASIKGLKRFKSGSIETFVPINSEEYLESAYSSNWRTPDPDWRYLFEPGLVEIEGEYGIKKKYV